MAKPYVYNVRDLATEVSYEKWRIGRCQSSSFLSFSFLYILSIFSLLGLFQIREPKTALSVSSTFVRRREVCEEVNKGYKDLWREEI